MENKEYLKYTTIYGNNNNGYSKNIFAVTYYLLNKGINNKCIIKYHVMLADMLHLNKYGRAVCGGTYQVFPIDIVVHSMTPENDFWELYDLVPKDMKSEGHLSESDKEMLDWAIKLLSGLDTNECVMAVKERLYRFDENGSTYITLDNMLDGEIHQPERECELDYMLELYENKLFFSRFREKHSDPLLGYVNPRDSYMKEFIIKKNAENRSLDIDSYYIVDMELQGSSYKKGGLYRSLVLQSNIGPSCYHKATKEEINSYFNINCK